MSRRSIVIAAAVVALIALALTYSAFDPSASRFFPRCPFLMLTGLKCPGCGTQRAIHSLLHGNFIAAVRFNALLVVSLPLLALYGYGELVRTRHPHFYRRINSLPAIIAVFVGVMLWWILRNIMGW